MDMIDIDSSVVPSKELDNTIKRKLLAKGIHVSEQDLEYGGAGCAPNARQLRVQMNSIHSNYQKMCVSWEIYEQPFVSHRPLVGKLIVFCKRVVRKLTRWLVLPYIAQIMNFHSATMCMIEEMIKLQEQLVMLEEARDQ